MADPTGLLYRKAPPHSASLLIPSVSSRSRHHQLRRQRERPTNIPKCRNSNFSEQDGEGLVSKSAGKNTSAGSHQKERIARRNFIFSPFALGFEAAAITQFWPGMLFFMCFKPNANTTVKALLSFIYFFFLSANL